MLKSLLVLAAAAATTPAFAGAHLTDAQYMQAARCQGLIAARALGPADATGINALMKREGAARQEAVYDRADEMRQDAARAAAHAGPYERAQLISERDGACRAFGADAATLSARDKPESSN